ncbi:MAG TPA: FGGY-family carbohydrate kinase, partial [Acidimicrobiales bacterium]|nr:FGGY-family carbohydrate kinase [Acidimicrobiales bacterium]
AHIVSAAVEAVCFQLAQGLADLEQDGEKALEIVANGGAIDRSPWWRARLASVLGRPLHCPTAQETTALGAAALALGVELTASSSLDQLVAPVEGDVGVLARARARWASWYDKLLPIARAAGE